MPTRFTLVKWLCDVCAANYDDEMQCFVHEREVHTPSAQFDKCTLNDMFRQILTRICNKHAAYNADELAMYIQLSHTIAEESTRVLRECGTATQTGLSWNVEQELVNAHTRLDDGEVANTIDNTTLPPVDGMDTLLSCLSHNATEQTGQHSHSTPPSTHTLKDHGDDRSSVAPTHAGEQRTAPPMSMIIRVHKAKSNVTDTATPLPTVYAYECARCGKQFARQTSLRMHISKHDDDARPYKCVECERRFTSRSNLKTHARTHPNGRPFACDRCDKAFRLKCHLQVHYRLHTNERPYVCATCDKSFSDGSLTCVCGPIMPSCLLGSVHMEVHGPHMRLGNYLRHKCLKNLRVQ